MCALFSSEMLQAVAVKWLNHQFVCLLAHCPSLVPYAKSENVRVHCLVFSEESVNKKYK